MSFVSRTASGSAGPRRSGKTWRWALLGGLLGAVAAAIVHAPASWLAHGLKQASDGRLLLVETRGSVWQGSAVLVLSAGADSRDAASLPGRIEWSLGLQGRQLLMKARQACCINGELQLLIQPGLGRLELALPGQPAGTWLARLPAAWLGGLGTPWNTLQLAGTVRLSSSDFRLEWAAGRWQQQGRLDLDFVNLASRVSTIAPLGSYRFSIAADPAAAGVSTLQLQTLDGALLLSGQGQIAAGRARFSGEASAAPGREAGLNNLLNIIGRRQGGRSLISIG